MRKVQTLLPAEFFSVIKDALPVCVSVGLAAAIGMVDIHLAGNLGSEVQAGVGIGDQFLFFAALLGTGIAQGAASLIARAVGAGIEDEAEVFARAGILCAVLFGLVSSLSMYFASDYLLNWFSQDACTVNSASTYLRLCSLANAPYCLMLTQSAILRARGRSLATIYPWLAAAAISISLSVSLSQFMPGGRQFTVEFIAIAWNLGAFAGMLVGQGQLKRHGFWTAHKNARAAIFQLAESARKIVGLGLPIAATEAALLCSNFFMYVLLSHLPSANEAQAAWTIRLKIEEMAATPMILAFSMTAASMAGQKIGRKDWSGAKRTARGASITAGLFMLIVGSSIFANSNHLARAQACSNLAAGYAETLLLSSIIIYPLTALYMTIFGALEGGGSTLKPMLAVIGGLYVLRIPLALVLVFPASMGMNGIVISIIFSHIAVTLSAVSQAKAFFAKGGSSDCQTTITKPVEPGTFKFESTRPAEIVGLSQ